MKNYYHWVGADSYIALTRCVCTTSTAMHHMNHFHESNCKQYCMLIQCIASGYINPRLPMVRKINRCKHDATTPSGCACHPSTGGELAVRYFFNSPVYLYWTSPLHRRGISGAVLFQQPQGDALTDRCYNAFCIKTLDETPLWL